MHLGQFRLVDGPKGECPGTYEFPGSLHLRTGLSDEVEQLGQNSFGGQQGKPELAKYLDTGLVPSVGAIQQCQNRSCIDQRISGHDVEPNEL